MKKYIYTVIIALFSFALSFGQPGKKQSQSILITNATAHIGNGEIIEDALIGFNDGKITLVADMKLVKTDLTKYEIIIDAKGKHVYPGLIAPNSTLGLVEIDAVKASDDESEISGYTPNVRTIIAFNTESKVIETAKLNGILTAQIAPRKGKVSGTSSIVQLDAWNWEEAILREDDGIHIHFPSTFKKTGWWAEPGNVEVNKDYYKDVEELKAFFQKAKLYNSETTAEKNLVFLSMKKLFEGKQTLFVNAQEEKQIIDAVDFFTTIGIKNIVIVGGYYTYKMTDFLKKHNISVLINRPHNLPFLNEDDIDLPYKTAKLLMDAGVLVGIENSGDNERMNTRNLPFLAGTCAAYGLSKESALQLITLNTAKILGIDAVCGTLEQGKDATLFISEGDALDMKTNNVVKAFIQGRDILLESHQTKLYKKYKEKYGQ